MNCFIQNKKVLFLSYISIIMSSIRRLDSRNNLKYFKKYERKYRD